MKQTCPLCQENLEGTVAQCETNWCKMTFCKKCESNKLVRSDIYRRREGAIKL